MKRKYKKILNDLKEWGNYDWFYSLKSYVNRNGFSDEYFSYFETLFKILSTFDVIEEKTFNIVKISGFHENRGSCVEKGEVNKHYVNENKNICIREDELNEKKLKCYRCRTDDCVENFIKNNKRLIYFYLKLIESKKINGNV